MNPESIPSKTPKGIAEIETRALRLNPKLRQALVRVDGVKSLEILIAEAGAMGEALEAQLRELLAQGFIVDASRAVVPAAAQPRPVAAAPAPAKRPDGLSSTLPLTANPELKLVTELKTAIRWLLAEAMGGAPGTMEIRLNQCRTMVELDKVIDEAFAPIQETAGKAKAVQFWRDAKALVTPAARSS
jgi:hypothetical protein